jgi:hypothetical protein
MSIVSEFSDNIVTKNTKEKILRKHELKYSLKNIM